MDEIQWEILEDGQLVIKTEEISEKNHMSADELLAMVEKLMGGKSKKTPVEHRFWNSRNVQRGGKIVAKN